MSQTLGILSDAGCTCLVSIASATYLGSQDGVSVSVAWKLLRGAASPH